MQDFSKDEEQYYRMIFDASLPYISKDLATKEKDWYEVKEYMEHLRLLNASFDIDQCYTNELVKEAAAIVQSSAQEWFMASLCISRCQAFFVASSN